MIILTAQLIHTHNRNASSYADIKKDFKSVINPKNMKKTSSTTSLIEAYGNKL